MECRSGGTLPRALSMGSSPLNQFGRFRGNEVSFVYFILGGVQSDRLAHLLLREKPLRFATAIFLDDRICRGQDGSGGSVILLERHHFRAGKVVLEFEQVLKTRLPPRIDG